MSKNILFFSRYCSHSIECIEKLGKKELDKMAKICVDDKKIRLPTFINVVPTIYLTDEKKILTDQDLELWITKQTQPKTELDNLGAYNSSGFSDMFAPLDGKGETNAQMKSASFLNEDISINTDGVSYKKRTLEELQREREL
tara:strand:- start:521 stop:946 length:426 start_codon:yes stop_codon:yes gene_type:complete